MHSNSAIDKTVSGGIHLTHEQLMKMYLNDEQILSLLMRQKNSPATFQRVLQSGLLQVNILYFGGV
jgi:hypothetical protein